MLKFFRKYNKWILSIGGSILMIAFLVPYGAGQMINQPTDEPIGTLAGQELTIADRVYASDQMQAISSVWPPLLMGLDRGQDPALRWLLIVHEAKAMGLSASNAQINARINSVPKDVSKGKNLVAEAAGNVGRNHDFVYEAFRNLITIEQYINLISGGDVRLTKPLLRRFISDFTSTVKVSLIEVSSSTLLDKAPKPTQEQLEKLFEKYSKNFKGEGEPYGFGYKYPDRVKLEYLAVPIDRVIKTVQVRDEEIYSYYQKNKQEFAVPASGATPDSSGPQLTRVREYKEVRAQIENKLRGIKARQLAEEMVQLAQNMLARDAAAVPDDNRGYRNVEAGRKRGWKPMPFDEVIKRIEKQFGVLPDYYRHDKNWLDRDALGLLKGLGAATLPPMPSNPEVSPPFVITEAGIKGGGFDYIGSARSFSPKGHPLIKHRLQKDLPSKPLQGADGSRYLVRLRDVAPSGEPESLDEVRQEVVSDARRLNAYEMLLNERDQWARRAAKEDFEKIAKELKASVLTPTAFTRRMMFSPKQAPNVVPIGQSNEFVDQVWTQAQQVELAGGVEKASMPQRTAAVKVDTKQSIYLVRIDELKPMTKSQFAQWSSPRMMRFLEQSLFRDTGQTQSPLALHVLAKRVGFLDAEGKSLKPPGEDSES